MANENLTREQIKEDIIYSIVRNPLFIAFAAILFNILGIKIKLM